MHAERSRHGATTTMDATTGDRARRAFHSLGRGDVVALLERARGWVQLSPTFVLSSAGTTPRDSRDRASHVPHFTANRVTCSYVISSKLSIVLPMSPELDNSTCEISKRISSGLTFEAHAAGTHHLKHLVFDVGEDPAERLERRHARLLVLPVNLGEHCLVRLVRRRVQRRIGLGHAVLP